MEVLRIQNAARNSTEWFENVERYAHLPTRAVRLFAAHPQPAHQPREPAAARQGLCGGLRGLDRRTGRVAPGAAAPAGAADVHALPGARHRAEEPRCGLADGAVLVCRRGAGRLPPGASGRPRHGRGRHGDGRDDLSDAGCPHHARLPRTVEYRPARRLEAHRRFRPCPHRLQDRLAARPCGGQGLYPGAMGRRRPAARAGQLAAGLGLAAAVRRWRERLVARDDACRHGTGARRLRAQHGDGGAGRFRLAGAALRPRLSVVQLHFAADQPAHRRIRRQPGKSAALPVGGVWCDALGLAAAAADVGPHLGPRLGRGRHHAGRCRGDRARLQGRRAPT